MKDPNFNHQDKKYLILTCEEGEVEYDLSEFSGNVEIASFDDEQLLTPDRLSSKIKRAGADVVLVEYNGMWALDSFYNAIPDNFMVYQEVCIIDSTTAELFNANMRQQMVDKLSSCEMVVFNRVTDSTDKLSLHKLVRGVSRKASICYENTEGEIEFDQIEDPLPYDINAPVVEIEDRDFAIFYRDLTEDFTKYNGKTLRFKGIVALDASLPKGNFAIGRHVMTCCEADIAYRGLVAKGMGQLKLSSRDWVTVVGKVVTEYSKLYRGEGPVLIVDKIERAEKPIDEVATFY